MMCRIGPDFGSYSRRGNQRLADSIGCRNTEDERKDQKDH